MKNPQRAMKAAVGLLLFASCATVDAKVIMPSARSAVAQAEAQAIEMAQVGSADQTVMKPDQVSLAQTGVDSAANSQGKWTKYQKKGKRGKKLGQAAPQKKQNLKNPSTSVKQTPAAVATTPVTVATIAQNEVEQTSEPKPVATETVEPTNTEPAVAEDETEQFSSIEATIDDIQQLMSSTPADQDTNTEAEVDTTDSTSASEAEVPEVQESNEVVVKEEQVQLTSQVSTENAMTKTTSTAKENQSQTTQETSTATETSSTTTTETEKAQTAAKKTTLEAKKAPEKMTIDALASEEKKEVVKKALTLLEGLDQPSKNQAQQSRVEKAYSYLERAMDLSDFSHEVKRESREALMTPMKDFSEFADELINESERNLGDLRVQRFALDDIYGACPNDRFVYHYDEIIQDNEVLDKTYLALRAKLYADLEVNKNIVSQIITPSDAKALGSWDLETRTFLESTKGSFDEEHLSTNLIDHNESTLLTLSEIRALQTVSQAIKPLDLIADDLISECDSVKSSFSVHNTSKYLDKGDTASIELIAEAVALEKSQIAHQITQISAKDSQQRIQSPSFMRAQKMIQQATQNGIWNQWESLTEKLDKANLL